MKPSAPLQVVLLEPFFGGSHRSWAEGLRRHSRHEINLLTLPGRHWKWRMHGGSVALAQQYRKLKRPADVLLATDMLDLSVFKGLTASLTADIPTAVYFHENQLSYPWSPTDADVHKGRDFHYGFINWTTALCADTVLFNSPYNRDSFLQEVRVLLKAMPDQRGLDLIPTVADKSQVLPLGIELADLYLSPDEKQFARPVILWNHRWEYDKNPAAFFRALKRLQELKIDFHLIVCGEGYGEYPEIFDAVKTTFSNELLHFGYAESREAYRHLLHQANILPVTSQQEFFGQSVMEAVTAGCYPILPDALAYPGHLPEDLRASVLYTAQEGLEVRLAAACNTLPSLAGAIARLQERAIRYDWSSMAPIYDKIFESMAQTP